MARSSAAFVRAGPRRHELPHLSRLGCGSRLLHLNGDPVPALAVHSRVLALAVHATAEGGSQPRDAMGHSVSGPRGSVDSHGRRARMDRDMIELLVLVAAIAGAVLFKRGPKSLRGLLTDSIGK